MPEVYDVEYITTPKVPKEIVKIAYALYHNDQFLGLPGSSGSKSTSYSGSNVISVPCVVILEAVPSANGLDACVVVSVRACSSMSDSDLEDVGGVSLGDQASLCIGVCGLVVGLFGHCETTIGGTAFSGSDIVGQERFPR